MLPRTHDPTYWALVQELMQIGWYRAGPGPDQEGHKTWGFREGHLTDTAHEPDIRWIPARNEQTAMRHLLDEMRPRPSRKSGRASRRR
jgi:hypothetical protein